ncbi:hypothetical protein OESDEN_00656 [Oesophagostomum dentatum]|uniref:Uncharacterized protein n=1 Tax=Oesophagostomum dentatum TaxID=61180 RepID=A0A0B1TPZ6_OESDE|nr:hypothetical protein OESDEN_00656 [Oesophagostomum dentatum]
MQLKKGNRLPPLSPKLLLKAKDKAPEAIPLLNKLVSVLSLSPKEIIEEEKRSRSVVISGLPEPSNDMPAFERQTVFIGKSMTEAERSRHKELRAEANRRNQMEYQGNKVYVVYRDMVIKSGDIPAWKTSFQKTKENPSPNN